MLRRCINLRTCAACNTHARQLCCCCWESMQACACAVSFVLMIACCVQFERTLIVAEDDSQVSYLEGCTAPSYDTNQVLSPS